VHERLEQRLHDLLRDQLWQEFRARVAPAAWKETIQTLVERRSTPHQAAGRLIEIAARRPAARPTPARGSVADRDTVPFTVTRTFGFARSVS
jgi:hypothetical protein